MIIWDGNGDIPKRSVQQFPIIFFIKLFNDLRGFLKKFFVDFLSGLQEFLHLCGKKIIKNPLFHGGRHGLRKRKAGGNDCVAFHHH